MSCQECIAIWVPSNCTHCLANSNRYECHFIPKIQKKTDKKIQKKLNQKKFLSQEMQKKNNAKQ